MKKFLKWIGLSVVGLLVLALVVGFFLVSKGKSKMAQSHEVSAALLSSVSSDSASLAHGMRLSKIHACEACHGEGLSGTLFVDVPPFRAVAGNLTSGKGGVGATYSVEDWDRTIRHGVKPDGSALLLMPAKTLHNLNNSDTEDLIAYLQTLAPVDNELPSTVLKPLGNLIAGLGKFDTSEQVTIGSNRTQFGEGETERGKYLASITCTYCHGADLSGGEAFEPGMLDPPDLAAAGALPLDNLLAVLREGKTSDGRQINTDHMPWDGYTAMTDEEIGAIHSYLKTL